MRPDVPQPFLSKEYSLARSKTSWLIRWWRSVRHPARTRTHRHSRPQLEALEDGRLLTAYTVTTFIDMLNDKKAGQVTLRDALTAISTGLPSGNAAAGTATNTINFNIGNGLQTINVGGGGEGAVPTITRTVVIDGTAPGAHPT